VSDPRTDLSEDLAFALPGGGHVLFTSRADGNMSSVGGVDHAQGEQACERLRTRLGLRALARGYQIHGTTVVSIRDETALPDPDPDPRPGPGPGPDSSPTSGRPSIQADGQATSLAGVGAMALAADCLPVALGCEGAVGMIHAGWRGLAAGVLEEGVRAVRELGGEGEIAAVIGPGAGPCCYEVGPEVHAAFDPVGAHPAGRGTIDLKAIATARLLTAGVDRVDDVELCTICDERFFSHRREGADAGRQAGVAWLA